MAAINQINVNIGTEQSPNYVLHDVNDKRISSTAVTTATHLLATNASLSAINPITAANLASVLGAFANAVTLSNNVTWNSLTSTCFVQATGNNGGVPSSMLYGTGLCIVNGTKGIQVYIPNSADMFIYIRQRWNGAWASSWKKVAYTCPQ